MYFSPKWWPFNSLLDIESLRLHLLSVDAAEWATKDMPKGIERIWTFREVYDRTYEKMQCEYKTLKCGKRVIL